MGAALVAMAAIQAGTSLIGGIIAGAQAKARAEFYNKLTDEQINLFNLGASREITKIEGTLQNKAAGGGVAVTGTVMDNAVNSVFDLQLERLRQVQQMRIEQMKQTSSANQEAQSQLIGGFVGALGAGMTASKAVKESSLIDSAKETPSAAQLTTAKMGID